MYDPNGAGAAPDDLLVRRGVARESAQRLARQAAAAEAAGAATNGQPFGHGVSLTSPAENARLARDPADAVAAPGFGSRRRCGTLHTAGPGPGPSHRRPAHAGDG